MHLLPLVRPLQVHQDRRSAFRALAGLARLYRLRPGERLVELVGLVPCVPAPGAFDVHLHEHREPAVYTQRLTLLLLLLSAPWHAGHQSGTTTVIDAWSE